MLIARKPITLPLLMASFLAIASCLPRPCWAEWSSASGLPQPSSLRLQDYEKQLFSWLVERKYNKWTADERVRDTGPFVDGESYGVHPAVRIYYSPEVIDWVENGRQGEIADGAIIVKEMFTPPAAIYEEIYRGLNSQYKDPKQLKAAYDEMLKSVLSGWTVMVKERQASKDGWFWSNPGMPPTIENPTTQQVVDYNLTKNYSGPVYSQFGFATCMRCHASAEKELTFSAISNFAGEPLQFRNDNSWRSKNYLLDPAQKDEWSVNQKAIAKARDEAGVTKQFPIPNLEIPWLEQVRPSISLHDRDYAGVNRVDAADLPTKPLPKPSPSFLQSYLSGVKYNPVKRPKAFSYPFEYADHVYPGHGGPGKKSTGPSEYLTSDNCVGCHGGLGGAPYGVTMFLQTGPSYGEGYNVSEYGEWRWSPMGLAGRDPIFHSQLECEMIMLLQDGEKDPTPLKASVAATQQAVVNTCLRCHGAMGQRQLHLDAQAGRQFPNGEVINEDFNPDYFSLYELLSKADPYPQPANPKRALHPTPQYKQNDSFYQYHKYGELAREGISCMICHRIAPPSESDVTAWVTCALKKNWVKEGNSKDVDALAYLLMKNTTGTYKRNERGDELYGPFKDVSPTPMQHALGITPRASPPAVGAVADPNTGRIPTFTQDSQMCGTCHAINLPNVGQKFDMSNVLNHSETVDAFKVYNHSIEQATFLEWQNSDFGPGVHNEPKKGQFKSCQDCHMPGGFHSLDGEINIDQLVTQIATIQDTTYPEVENQAPAEKIQVASRSDYRRHQLVGLNAFLIEMMNQFPDVLGIDNKERFMTFATTGSSLAMDSMLMQARNDTLKVEFVGNPTRDGNKLTADLKITNLTGHRFPSGVSFRRAFVEFVVQQNGKTIWASGKTNAAGVIVGGDGMPLKTELLNHVTPGNVFADYQPHYQVITSPNQVQIYEELILDGYVPPEGTPADQLPNFTTSFIHRITHVKDNRLLPKGWVPSEEFASQGEVIQQFMRATDPEGPSVIGGETKIGKHPEPNGALISASGNKPAKYQPDPEYTAAPSPAADKLTYEVTLKDVDDSPLTVTATVYSQSLMPAWLHQRFSQAAWAKRKGYATPETDRLLYITSRLNLKGTAIDNWKLPLAAPVSVTVNGN